MSRIEDVARRREDWQKARAGLPWGEKIRMAARLRDVALAIRKRPAAGADGKAQPALPSRGR